MQPIWKFLLSGCLAASCLAGLSRPVVAREPGELRLLPPVDDTSVAPATALQEDVPANPPAELAPAPEAIGPVPEESAAPPGESAALPEGIAVPPEEIVAPPEEVIEYLWFDPHYWFRPPFWEGSIEAGINGSEGNSNSFSIKAGMSLKRTTESNVMGFNLNYARTSTEDIETQHYALLNTEYERLFPDDSRWSLFAKSMVQYDEFQAFDLRVALNGGLAYRFIKTENLLLKGRFGAGASREFGGPNETWSPEAVLGADYEHQLTKKQKLVLNVDYFPEWGDFNNFRVLTVFAWEVVLDEEANLHFKLAINDQYDSTPEGRRPNDINYSMLLLWKL